MLKVIAGEVKGRTLFTLSSPHVRPILAQVKKSLFDIIRNRLPRARFLDLYAGSGAVGIEALSRGAAYAVFVERDQSCLRLLRKNLEKFNYLEKSSVYRLDATGDLSILPGPFDVIFMGPPYKDEGKMPLALVAPTLAALHRHRLLQPSGLIIAQHHKKEHFQEPIEDWAVTRTERYGDTVLTFIGPRG